MLKRAALAALIFFLLLIFSVATAPFLVGAPRVLSGFTDSARRETAVVFDGQRFSAFVADTPSTQQRGLGGRESIEPLDGMLFVFERDGRYAIWMKDMRFAIDIIWVSAGGMVVDVRTNVSPDSYPETFEPKDSARYIFEAPAGFAERFGVKIGSSFSTSVQN